MLIKLLVKLTTDWSNSSIQSSFPNMFRSLLRFVEKLIYFSIKLLVYGSGLQPVVHETMMAQKILQDYKQINRMILNK
jgi:hypothetical protein